MAGDKKRPGPKPGDPRMVECGRQGGAIVLRERGREFFQQIGKKGGAATRAKHGPEFFSRIGVKGGETNRAKGSEYFSTIGRQGAGVRRPRNCDTREAILKAIADTIATKGYAPSVSELAAVVGIHVSTVHYHLLRLENEGRIRREPDKARALVVV